MADNQSKYELIEQYLSNSLSDADRSMVEDMLRRDPGFSQEVEFQRDVIDTLKEFRKAELKTRLANIPVQASLIGSLASSSAYLKTLMVASVTGIVGVGLYFPRRPPLMKKWT